MKTRTAAKRPCEAAGTLDGLQLAARAELALAFEEHRDRLLRLISLRLDRRLAGRVDPTDIIQDAFIRANAAYDEYRRQSDLPLYNWLCILAQFAVGDLPSNSSRNSKTLGCNGTAILPLSWSCIL